mgnify:CR=1 FL=1
MKEQQGIQYSIFMESIKNKNEQLHKINQAMPLTSIIDEQHPLHIELNQIYTDLCKLSDSIKLSDLEESISFIRRTNGANNHNSGYNSWPYKNHKDDGYDKEIHRRILFYKKVGAWYVISYPYCC